MAGMRGKKGGGEILHKNKGWGGKQLEKDMNLLQKRFPWAVCLKKHPYNFKSNQDTPIATKHATQELLQ